MGCDQVNTMEILSAPSLNKKKIEDYQVTIEAEVPEVLYRGMKDFIRSNPNWDQYKLMSSAIANFLFQNGCNDRAVTEKYLNDLFTIDES